MTHTTPQHTIACVPLPEDECICPDLVPGEREIGRASCRERVL